MIATEGGPQLGTQMSNEHLERILEGASSFSNEVKGAFESSSIRSLRSDAMSTGSKAEATDVDPGGKAKVLCQTVSKNLNKTPTGKIYEVDLKDMFSLMILQLNLRDEHGKKSLLSKNYPFSFTIDQALTVLESLNYNIENSMSVISLSYNISKPTGLTSIDKFFDAKLLHCPSDRTREKPKSGVLLQPTPKGVAIIKKFIFAKGIKFTKVPPILVSSLTSMDLFYFDRNYLNDKIIYSVYLVKILFIRMFGTKPNVWSPMNSPEKFNINYDLDFLSNQLSSIGSGYIKDSVTSPLHHKYFTNPESDSHVQYYSSRLGVRVFHNKVFDGTKYNYCVSGKAIIQWLMDCSDILSAKSAFEVANLFLSLKFLVPITGPPPSLNGSRLSINYCYAISDKGKKLLLWYKPSTIKLVKSINNSGVPRNYRLAEFLNDPGLKFLFRVHLTNEFCSENIDAYVQLQVFLKKFNLLTKILNYNELVGNRNGYSHQLYKISNDCLTLAYHIYFTYLSPKASFVLNIDYNLRTKTTGILIGSSVPSTLKASDIYNYYYESNSNNVTPTSISSSFSSLNIQDKSNPPINTDSDRNGSSSDSSHTFTIPGSVSNSMDSPSMSIETPKAPTQDHGDDSSVFSGSREQQSVTETKFDSVYTSLLEFAPVANELTGRLFRLMEVDSFPKFLESKWFKDHQSIFDS